MKNCMLLTIVKKGAAEKVMASYRAAGAPGGTIINARGTATNAIMAMLGLGDSHKEILVNLINVEDKGKMLSAAAGTKAKGVVAAIEEETENMSAKWQLIEVISADGMSEDIMAVARKAGAEGGTVITARGTSTEDDVKFFGAPLVPEKEVLLIVAETEKAEKVVAAIGEMKQLRRKGMGIMFTLPVTDFRNFG